MNIIPTHLNRQLAGVVQDRIAADQSYISGRSGFWRAVGVGLVGFGIGATLGLGFYGYSHITRNSNNSEILASAFAKALSEVSLHAIADGIVKLEPRDIRLAKGQTIAIDGASRLRLDPAAKVFADGELRVQAPSVTTPQITPRGSPRAPTITNFTIFKSVPFQQGTVLTGWMFLTSAQRVPTTQYCYYNESGDISDISIRINIGTDEKIEVPKTPVKDFDTETAFTKCVWFKKG
jgi:hypothetical protein